MKTKPDSEQNKQDNVIVTDKQRSVFSHLNNVKVASASWHDRHLFEALVHKGLVMKHYIGRQVTYTITDK